jgi:hypothetical protein
MSMSTTGRQTSTVWLAAAAAMMCPGQPLVAETRLIFRTCQNTFRNWILMTVTFPHHQQRQAAG